MSIFTKIINKEIPSYVIKESDLFYAFLDIFPLQKGHVLVVPKIEIDKIFDLPDQYLSELLVFAKPIAKSIEKTFSCNRVSIVTVGLEVPHAHVHLIPMNEASDIEFSKPKLQLTKEEFLSIQELIIANL
jgi:histidine triad (HIT) family protein